MPLVTGTPDFPFYMPDSGVVEGPADEILRQRALALAARGYKAGVNIHEGDPYLGRTVEIGDLYYQAPRVPGYHFVQQFVEGEPRPPAMYPGSLEQRIALELAQRKLREYEDEYHARAGLRFQDIPDMPAALAAYQQQLNQGPVRRMRP